MRKEQLKRALMPFVMMLSFALTGQEVVNEAPTEIEYEAAVYCDACFDTLDALERQKDNLKLQIESRGLVVAESKATIETMQLLIGRMRDQYYLSEKAARKAKRRAFWRGFGTGAAVVAGGVVALVVSQ